jgi:hypothetical protein
LRRGHVDAIQVGTFFAIHFDVDEVLVHQRCGFRVFEGFVCHDMTPVASRIADAQKDGLVLSFGFCQGFVTPGIPVHRIIGVLEKIRGSFSS